MRAAQGTVSVFILALQTSRKYEHRVASAIRFGGLK
jgi:hypothetical protein